MGVRREARGQLTIDLPPELTRRSDWWEERRAERAAMRAEFKEARRHGLYVRHTMKLQRLERQADAIAVTSRPAGRTLRTPASTSAPAATTALRHQPVATTAPVAATPPDRAIPQSETAANTNPAIQADTAETDAPREPRVTADTVATVDDPSAAAESDTTEGVTGPPYVERMNPPNAATMRPDWARHGPRASETAAAPTRCPGTPSRHRVRPVGNRQLPPTLAGSSTSAWRMAVACVAGCVRGRGVRIAHYGCCA
jgi:hypothetical protein